MTYKVVLAFILPMLSSVLEGAMADAGKNFDAARVMKEIEPKIRSLIPGTWFDGIAVTVVRKILTAVDQLLDDSKIAAEITALVAAGKYAEAAEHVLELALTKIFG